MHDYDEDNDGRYPDESPVEVRYPRSKQEDPGRLTGRRRRAGTVDLFACDAWPIRVADAGICQPR